MKQIKKKTLRLIVLISIITFGVIMQGCDNQLDLLFEENLIESQEVFSSDVKIAKLLFDTWQDQLDYLISKGSGVQFITEQGLILVDYKLIDKNISKNIFIESSSHVVYYNDPKDPNRFDILPLSQVKQVNPNIDKEYSEFKNKLLDSLSTVDLSNVLLTWRYQGNEFITKCLVTDNEVVYDDILSRIRIIIQVENDNVVNNSFSRLKSGNESGQDGSINYGFGTPRREVYSYSGHLKAYAYCQFNVRGTKQNGIKGIENCHYEAFQWAENDLYHAAAQIKLVTFVSGPNGHAHIEYACAADSKPVGISWNGTSFTIAGGENNRFSGGQYVSPSMLY